MQLEKESADSRPVVCTTGNSGVDELDEKLSRSWLQIAVAAVFAGQGMVFSLAVNMTPPEYGSLPYWILHGGLMFSALVVIGFLGRPLFASTLGMIRAKRLSIEGLFSLSLVGAFIGSMSSSLTGEGAVFYEVVAVVIAIYTVGRMLGERSQTQLTLQSQQLRETYDQADAIDEQGVVCRMPLSELVLGSRVQVEPGQPFTVDGILRSGIGYVRETALTGEPLPVVKRSGDQVRAGTWSVDGLFVVEVEALEGARELDAILETVDDFGGRSSALQKQADQLIQAFLPFVAGTSVATAIYWGFMGTWVDAVLNSMAVLLVACPCALGLATPVAIWQGLFQLAKKGLVSRDGAFIDALAETKHLFLDKTGTLTEAEMQVTEIVIAEPWLEARNHLLAAVRLVETHAAHPVARSVALAIDAEVDGYRIERFEIIPGEGVTAKVVTADGGRIALQIGEANMVETDTSDLEVELKETQGKRIFVFVDSMPAAVFILKERPREGLGSVWDRLKAMEIRTTILTGDPNPQMHLPEFVAIHVGQSARQKSDQIRRSSESQETPVLVGDGLNDAGAMACASASIAMGSGVALARTVATGQLRNDQISILPDAILLSRGIHRRLRANLKYAAAYNIFGMSLAAAGWLHPVLAAVIMLGSSFFVTARALRAGD